MENKICPVCQAPNEEAYLFCKHCGTSLRDVPPAQQANIPPEMQAPPPYYAAPDAPEGGYPPPPDYSPYGAQPGYAPEELIEGVPVSQAAAYLGPKNQAYVGKFLAMERSGSQASFNGVVFVLGFLLGPLGGAIWFLQKKLYLLGVLLMAVGILLTGVNLVASYKVFGHFAQLMAEDPNYSFDGSGEFNYQFGENSVTDQEMLDITFGLLGSSSLTGLLSLVLSIITAVYANFWYKRRMGAVVRSLADGSGYADPGRLALSGGNSAAWVIPLVLLILMPIVSLFVIIIPVISVMPTVGNVTIALSQLLL